MKLNLRSGQNIKNGYLNIDILDIAGFPDDIYKRGDFTNLDWAIEDNSLEEIASNDALSYIPLSHIEQVLKNWSSKLTNNGKLYIQGINCDIINRLYNSNQMTIIEFNAIIFSNNIRSISNKDILFSHLKNSGFRIDSFTYDGISMDIWAVKND